MKCVLGKCADCGESCLRNVIETENKELLAQNQSITWCKWAVPKGRSAHGKVQFKGTVKNALDELMLMLSPLKSHLFCANWNRNIFDYIRKNLEVGQIVQIFDLHRDSFVARAGHDAAFKHLVQLGIPIELIMQFSDNCSSQYKSCRPFAELVHCSIPIIRVYFSENHGKSRCDGFFGRLKSWITYRIKARHVIINDTNDFFRYCKAEYETAEVDPSCCQHYKVAFQYLRLSDICRHQDCDLDKAVPGTRNIYSVRNTPHPLKLKVCNVPCLCKQCLLNNGDICKNLHYANAWREVNLIPVKGQSKCKHMK